MNDGMQLNTVFFFLLRAEGEAYTRIDLRPGVFCCSTKNSWNTSSLVTGKYCGA